MTRLPLTCIGLTSLLVWLLAGEQLCVARDATLYNHSLLIGLVFALVLIGVAMLPTPTEPSRKSVGLIATGILGAGASVTCALFASNEPGILRVVTFAVQSSCSATHVLAWGDALSKAPRTRSLTVATCAGALACLLSQAMALLPTVPALLLLACMPICSCGFHAAALRASLRQPEDGSPDGADGQPEELTWTRDATRQRNGLPIALVASVCSCSLAAALFCGLATSPYSANSTVTSTVSTGIAALVIGSLALGSARLARHGRAAEKTALPQAGSPAHAKEGAALVQIALAAPLVLLITGALLLSLKLTGTMLAAISLTSAAKVCLFVLCWAVFPRTATRCDSVSGSRPFAFLVLGSGAFWAPCVGSWVAKTVNLQFSELVDVATALIALVALIALAYMALHMRQRSAGQHATAPSPQPAQDPQPLTLDEIHEALRAHWVGMMESYGLTEREREVALLLIDGQTMGSVAEQLFITERTVKFHCKNIYEKLGVKNKKELMQMFSGL